MEKNGLYSIGLNWFVRNFLQDFFVSRNHSTFKPLVMFVTFAYRSFNSGMNRIKLLEVSGICCCWVTHSGTEIRIVVIRSHTHFISSKIYLPAGMRFIFLVNRHPKVRHLISAHAFVTASIGTKCVPTRPNDKNNTIIILDLMVTIDYIVFNGIDITGQSFPRWNSKFRIKTFDKFQYWIQINVLIPCLTSASTRWDFIQIAWMISLDSPVNSLYLFSFVHNSPLDLSSPESRKCLHYLIIFKQKVDHK